MLLKLHASIPSAILISCQLSDGLWWGFGCHTYNTVISDTLYTRYESRNTTPPLKGVSRKVEGSSIPQHSLGSSI